MTTRLRRYAHALYQSTAVWLMLGSLAAALPLGILADKPIWKTLLLLLFGCSLSVAFILFTQGTLRPFWPWDQR